MIQYGEAICYVRVVCDMRVLTEGPPQSQFPVNFLTQIPIPVEYFLQSQSIIGQSQNPSKFLGEKSQFLVIFGAQSQLAVNGHQDPFDMYSNMEACVMMHQTKDFPCNCQLSR